MAKKGIDEDRLKFFRGMGATGTSEPDKPEPDKPESNINKSTVPESDKTESDKTESDKTEPEAIKSTISESDIIGAELVTQDRSESDVTKSELSEPGKSESDRSEIDVIKSVISEPDEAESDKSESDLSESDNRRSVSRRRKQTPKVSLPRSRAHSTIPKIRARKVDDSVLDQAMLAASNSPKVSIYSPFVAAVMKCNELTTIGYKSSADSRELLEKALEQAYPDVCEKVRKYIGSK